jgi:hypothetical protein
MNFEVQMINLTGQRFDRLLVQEFAGMSKNCQSMWTCICDCGNTKSILGQSLRNGKTRSCGCYKKEQIIKANTTHGQARRGFKTRAYRIWLTMLQRGTNPKTNYFKNYEPGNENVCNKWLTFEGFYEDMGDCPKGMTLDRKDNIKGYYKENCRWATPKEQSSNRKSNVYKTYKEETKTISQWAEHLNMPFTTLWNRLNTYGWSIERALTTPVGGYKL